MVNHSPSTDPDHHLVRALAQGNAQALHHLYGRYGPGLLNHLADIQPELHRQYRVST